MIVLNVMEDVPSCLVVGWKGVAVPDVWGCCTPKGEAAGVPKAVGAGAFNEK